MIASLPEAPRHPDGWDDPSLTQEERDALIKEFCDKADAFMAALPWLSKELEKVARALESNK